jgi:hypothetical protein
MASSMVTISHKYRFLFIKTRKTAGSSVEHFLIPHLGPTDVVLSSNDKGEEVRYPSNAPDALFSRLTEHMTASELRDVVGWETFHAYHKFTIERNPWDRMISLWRWRQKITGINLSFDDWLEAIEQRRPTAFFTEKRRHWSNWLLYTARSKVLVDKIMRYEFLIEEMSAFCNRFSIPFNGELPSLKAHVRHPDDRAATLTEEQVRRIATLCYREVRFFGYSAPRQSPIADKMHRFPQL